MNVRPFNAADAEAVIALWHECGLVVPWNDPRKDIARKLEVNPDWFLVGEAGGRIVATCMTGYDGHRGWLNYLAVAPSDRGRGYGRGIVAAAEAILRAAGCPKINLQVRSGNTDAIEFYRRIGFRVDDVVSFGKRLESDEPAPGISD